MSLATKLASFGRLIRTLLDIGPTRLQRRLRYELRQRLDRHLPHRISLSLARASSRTPAWRMSHQTASFNGELSPPITAPSLRAVCFSFLNEERELPWPMQWNDPQWPRLWQFHLHYFDWAREWLDDAQTTGHWPAQSAALQALLDSWIASNPPGRGDGWHSYTLSLRTRNWIALFRACPDLITPDRLQSLWQQLCWLKAHPEDCHGGNHWLENLTALAVGGLQFEGPKASGMHRRAMRLLQMELEQQILSDGGHEERSASYHLLILYRLGELLQALQSSSSLSPQWLMETIEVMANWAQLIRLETGESPRFNDSAADAAPPIDVVLSFAADLLPQRPISAKSPLIQAVVTDLPDTGWTFLRPGHGWQLMFKCGIPCPNHLPPHVHSDQLSFELCHHGRWLLSEAGTSTYGIGPERIYERSGAAHNVLQIGVESTPGVIRWIEPVDVWNGFRAGRKAKPRDRAFGQISQGVCFVEGSHDGFDHIGVSHHRRVTLSNPLPSQINIEVLDTVITHTPLYVRQWWHLGPEMNRDLIEKLVVDAPTLADAVNTWHSTWFSTGFGQRLPRQSLCVAGRLSAGEHHLRCSHLLSIQ